MRRGELKRGAGLVVLARNGRMLFLRRTDGTWGIPGGHAERGEEALETALREFAEETGFSGNVWVDDVPVTTVCIRDRGLAPATRAGCPGAKFVYTVFAASVPEPFRPVLDEEHTDFEWARPALAPEPLHPGVAIALSVL